MHNALAISMPGTWEWAVILVVGLLIFGRRLPEIGRSVGRTIIEFKKGLKDVQDDVNVSASAKDPDKLPMNQRNPNLPPPGGPS